MLLRSSRSSALQAAAWPSALHTFVSWVALGWASRSSQVGASRLRRTTALGRMGRPARRHNVVVNRTTVVNVNTINVYRT